MITSNIRVWIPVALSLLAAGAAVAQVSNGDFANIGGVWVDNTGYGSDDLQTPGSTNIPGWTNVPGAANEFWVASSNLYGLSPAPGNGSQYFVDLTGQANNKPYGGIEQTISTTAGTQYKLTFDLGSSTTYNSAGLGAAALTASAAGASALYTLTPTSSNQWAAETLLFTATGSSTTIEFLADSAYTSRYTGLDNVSVQRVGQPTAAPEIDATSAAAGLTLLLGGITILRGRRAAKGPRRPSC